LEQTQLFRGQLIFFTKIHPYALDFIHAVNLYTVLITKRKYALPEDMQVLYSLDQRDRLQQYRLREDRLGIEDVD
jgi:hypothetical protein